MPCTECVRGSGSDYVQRDLHITACPHLWPGGAEPSSVSPHVEATLVPKGGTQRSTLLATFLHMDDFWYAGWAVMGRVVQEEG